MIKRTAIAAAALAMLAAPAVQAEDAPMTKGEAKLAKMLEGRVVGEAKSCIRTVGSRNLQQIDDTALVYRDGRTLWVNYTRDPGSIDDYDIMVIHKFSPTSLCRTDRIDLVDRNGGFLNGVLMLDDFIPYRLPETEAEG